MVCPGLLRTFNQPALSSTTISNSQQRNRTSRIRRAIVNGIGLDGEHAYKEKRPGYSTQEHGVGNEAKRVYKMSYLHEIRATRRHL